MARFYKNILLPGPALALLMLGFSTSAISQARKSSADSIKIAIEPVYDLPGKSHRFFFGEGYRKLWSTPVTVPVFNLAKEKGGLKILEKGGGMQTKSLRLQDATGQEWVIRSIQKYPERVLPPTLRKSVAADIIQDQIAAEHPFSAITVPPMAEALGIPHANPKLVYVPDDAAFGSFQKDFANQVFLFEEREPLDASKTDNTDKMREKLLDDNDNSLDQKTFLKARLLDMVLGDWDRHADQWRWERTKGKNGTIYEPVPRDRDQVYYTTDGVLPWLVSHHLLMSKFQSFEGHIRSVSRWNFNARFVDREFLTGLDEKDWITAIEEVQSKLTDELITKSIKLMPADIYKLCGQEITQKVIARRNELKETGLRHYRSISKVVEILGTDKHEQVSITNEASGKVYVKINKIKKDGDKEQVIYKRTFDPAVTKEIRIYGMDGKDIFAVHGAESSKITVRMIGGGDEDTFTIDSNVTGKGKRYIYDRSDKKNTIPSSAQAHIRTSADTAVNSYKHDTFKYDFFQPLILGSYNRDYGVQFLGTFILQKQGFRKDPYAYRQSLTVNYGFGAEALLLKYNGEFIKAVGNNDLLVSASSKGPNYTSYFFGVGNNTEFVNEGKKKARYYRNIYNYLDADIRLRHRYDNWTVSAGVGAAYYNGDADDNQNKYLEDYNLQHPEESVYAGHGFAGALATVTLDTRNKSIVPHKGVYWITDLRAMKGLNPVANSYGQIKSEFSFFITPGSDSTFIVADRIGGGTTFGNAAYFQQLTLGGSQNLRGFYSWRFTGKSMAYNNFEVRMKLADVTSYLLPGTLGLIAFNDIGRVWTPGEKSDALHVGYGGGLFFLPGELFLVQGVVGFSKEGVYPYISAGFRF